MTPELIAELRRLLAEATPAPWTVTEGWEQNTPGTYIRNHNADVVFAADIEPPKTDAELIVAAVNSLPALLNDHDELLAIVRDLAEKREIFIWDESDKCFLCGAEKDPDKKPQEHDPTCQWQRARALLGMK